VVLIPLVIIIMMEGLGVCDQELFRRAHEDNDLEANEALQDMVAQEYMPGRGRDRGIEASLPSHQIYR